MLKIIMRGTTFAFFTSRYSLHWFNRKRITLSAEPAKHQIKATGLRGVIEC